MGTWHLAPWLLALSLAGAAPESVPAQYPPRPPAQFTIRQEVPPADITALSLRFDTTQVDVLEALNRADAAHLVRLDLILVPEVWAGDRLAYSPFPVSYSWRADESKLLVVDQAAQAFAAYESGRLVRWGPVSSGRRMHATPAGLFHLTWRSRGRHSTVNPDWFMPWYFNFHNERGLSFHEYTLPGTPASHACVRLLERDARWLFNWGETWTLDDRGWNVLDPGTPVLIANCYAYDSAPPWRSPDWWSAGIQLPAAPWTVERSCAPEAR